MLIAPDSAAEAPVEVTEPLSPTESLQVSEVSRSPSCHRIYLSDYVLILVLARC